MSKTNHEHPKAEQSSPEQKAKAWEELATKAAEIEEADKDDNDAEALELLTHEELQAEIDKLKANQEDLLRSLAKTQDSLNRANKETEKAGKFAVTKLTQDFLPVVDSLELSLQAIAPDNEAFKNLHEGIEMTFKILMSTLEKYGVTVVNPLNEKFDPNFHEAISMQEDAGLAAGMVLNVLQKGYVLHDRLIRPAMVIVAKAQSDTKVTD